MGDFSPNLSFPAFSLIFSAPGLAQDLATEEQLLTQVPGGQRALPSIQMELLLMMLVNP